MVTRVDKYLGGLGIDATGKLEVTDNAAVVVGNGTTTGNVYAGTINSGGVELRSNDYATLLSARSNDYASYLTLSGGISSTNTNLAGNVAIFTGAFTGTNTNLSGNVAIFNGAFTGTNTNLSGNVAIFNGAFTGSNSRLAATEANVLSIRGGLTGANTNISAITGSPVTFQSDVTIRGNLTLTGNTTIVTANTVSFGDTLLSLGANNTTSDTVDIGLYGHYWNGTANSHSGIVRSANTKEWMIFAGYTIDLEGNSTINMSNSSFQLGSLRVSNTNASINVYAANAVISSNIYSNGVELRSNDYATLLSSYSNDGSTLLSARSNDYSTYVTLSGGLSGANTNIISLQGGISGANTNINLKANIASPTFTGVVTTPALTLSTVGGDEGGQLDFGAAATNTTLVGGIAIDIYQNKMRFFEKGGSIRGAYIDLTAAGSGIGSNLLAGSGSSVPTGAIIMYGANTAPSGWLVCDGTAVSRTSYSTLFTTISNTFGNGDGSTTFNVPDFRGRSPYGVDASQSLLIGSTSSGKINTSYQNSTSTGTTGTGTTGTGTTGTSTTAITATTSNATTTVSSSTSTGTTGTGTGTIPAATYSTGAGTGTIPALTYSTGTGTTGTGTTANSTTGTSTTGSGGSATHTLTTVAYQQPVLVKDQSPNYLVTAVADHAAHTHSVPGLTIPGLSVPGLSVPALSIPAMNVSVPGLSIPTMNVSVPGLSIPALTIPSLTVASHSHNVPALTVPGLSIPGLSIPGLSVPALTVTHPATIVQFIIKT